jgi:hypothetical protein
MRPSFEIPHLEGFEQGKEGKKSGQAEKADLKPQKETVDKQKDSANRVREAKEREQKSSFLERIDSPITSFENTFNGSKIKFGQEERVVTFSGFNVDGTKAGDKEKLAKDVKAEQVKMGQISCPFKISPSEKGGLDSSVELPLSRVMALQDGRDLEKAVVSAFGGDLEHSNKEKNQKAAESTKPLDKQKPADTSDKQKVLSLLSQAKKDNHEVSTLNAGNLTIVSVRLTEKKQLNFSSNDLAVWTATTVSNGKLTGKTSTENPVELLKLNDKDLSA